MSLKRVWKILNTAAKNYSGNDTATLGAALSYYTIFSLAPILIIIILLTGFLFGAKAMSGEIFNQIRGMLGDSAALQVQEMIKGAYNPGGTRLTAFVAGVLLVFGATSVFTQLQTSLNIIWGVKPKPKLGLTKYFRDRVLSFSLIISLGFLMLVSLSVNAVLVAAAHYFQKIISHSYAIIFQIIELGVSFMVITLLFALIYKYLPNVKVKWKFVWAGAIFTAFLFVLGKYIIGLYLGTIRISTTYGAAASIVLLLLWVYYSAQIVFFGAEFTQAYAEEFGRHMYPSDYAIKVKIMAIEQETHENFHQFKEKVTRAQEIVAKNGPKQGGS